jgi:hypothetical protein
MQRRFFAKDPPSDDPVLNTPAEWEHVPIAERLKDFEKVRGRMLASRKGSRTLRR